MLSAFENDVTHSKMRELQSRLKNLRLNRTEVSAVMPLADHAVDQANYL